MPSPQSSGTAYAIVLTLRELMGEDGAFKFMHDLNPDYTYNARPDDPPVMKRKVIRGGSWKDIAYYMQNGTRTYEYQDTTKSYIGFRCIRPVLGGI